MNVHEFCVLIDKIGKTNGSAMSASFTYNWKKVGNYPWAVAVEETTDGHYLTTGVGDTPDDACKDASHELQGIVEKLWGWKWPLAGSEVLQ